MILRLKYLWIYIMFGCTILVMVVSSYIVVQKKIKTNLVYTQTLTYVARQSTLAHELANESEQLVEGGTMEAQRWKMEQKLGKWNKIQRALLYNTGEFGLSLKMEKAMQDKLVAIGYKQLQLTKNIAWLIQHPGDKNTANYIAAQLPAYSAAISELTDTVSQQAQVDLMGLRRQEKQLATIWGLILLLEMVIIVSPYHRKLLKAYSELKLRKRQLTVNQKLVTDLNNAQSLMIAGINAGVWDWNLESGKEKWSKRFYNLLGYEERDVQPGNEFFINKLVHGDDRLRLLEATSSHFKRKTPYAEEVRLKTKLDGYKWFEISGQAQWNAAGKVTRFAGSVIDIDEIVRYRSRLEYSDFMLGEVGKMASVGGWEYDIPHNRITWTKGMYDINEVVMGEDSTLDMQMDNYAKKHQQLISDVIEHTSGERPTYDEEFKLVTAKGNERWVRVIGKAQYDEKHVLVKVRGVYQDIHARKLKELELEEAKQDLASSNNTKDKLLSIIAHDLRSPMNNIKSLIELKSAAAISQEEFITYLDDIKANIEQVSGAMENMLEWAFSQKDGFKIVRTKVRLLDVANMAANLYTRALLEKNIDFHNNVSSEHFANADTNHAFLIVRNLLNNAVKFTPAGGRISINSFVKDGEVKISVMDNGVGMSPETLEKIRKNLSLQSTKGTNGERGTGLGLSFCFEIAEKNGGRIEVDSQPGKGSIFSLVLPAYNRGDDSAKKISGGASMASS